MPRAKPVMGVDVPRLWEAVAVRLARLDLTEQALAAQLGIAKQTLWWLHREARNPESDYQPSAQVFLTLCWWLDANPEEFRKRLRLGPPVAEFVEAS